MVTFFLLHQLFPLSRLSPQSPMSPPSPMSTPSPPSPLHHCQAITLLIPTSCFVNLRCALSYVSLVTPISSFCSYFYIERWETQRGWKTKETDEAWLRCKLDSRILMEDCLHNFLWYLLHCTNCQKTIGRFGPHHRIFSFTACVYRITV